MSNHTPPLWAILLLLILRPIVWPLQKLSGLIGVRATKALLFAFVAAVIFMAGRIWG